MNSGRGCWDVKPVSSVNALGPDIEEEEEQRWAESERRYWYREIPGVRCTRQTGSMLPVCSRAFKQRVIDWLRLCQTDELEIFALAFSGPQWMTEADMWSLSTVDLRRSLDWIRRDWKYFHFRVGRLGNSKKNLSSKDRKEIEKKK